MVGANNRRASHLYIALDVVRVSSICVAICVTRNVVQVQHVRRTAILGGDDETTRGREAMREMHAQTLHVIPAPRLCSEWWMHVLRVARYCTCSRIAVRRSSTRSGCVQCDSKSYPPGTVARCCANRENVPAGSGGRCTTFPPDLDAKADGLTFSQGFFWRSRAECARDRLQVSLQPTVQRQQERE